MGPMRVFCCRYTVSNGYISGDCRFSCFFCVFWVLEAARGKFKETLVRIKVVYGIYKHFKSVRYEKWSYCGYLSVKPFLTATFLKRRGRKAPQARSAAGVAPQARSTAGAKRRRREAPQAGA